MKLRIKLLLVVLFALNSATFTTQAISYKQYKNILQTSRTLGAIGGIFAGMKIIENFNCCWKHEHHPCVLLSSMILGSYIAQKIPQYTSFGYFYRAQELIEKQKKEFILKWFEETIQDKENFIDNAFKLFPYSKYPLIALFNNLKFLLHNLEIAYEYANNAKESKFKEDESNEMINYCKKGISNITDALAIIKQSSKWSEQLKEINFKEEIDFLTLAVLIK